MLNNKTNDQARSIAIDNLRQCYKNGKVIASTKNYSDNWARDTFWALPGVLEIGDKDIALNCLEYFLSFQRKDGKIPRKIAIDFNGIKYLTGKSFLRKNPRPIYTGNLPPFSSMDANSLLIIAVAEFIKTTGDKKFAKVNYEKMKAAIDWYEYHMKDDFVCEYALGNWMDTIFKKGSVLYTNVLYCAALQSFVYVAKNANQIKDSSQYKKKYSILKQKINSKFWNGKYFDDQLGMHKHFDMAGNVLALHFEIVDEKRRKKIIEKIIQLRKGRKLLPSVSPKYAWWKVNPVTYLVGMQDYHNDISWMWIDLYAVAALFKNGYKEEAKKIFLDISEIIINNNAVHETFFSNGTPYKTWHWQSAVPFAWSSGVFLKVYSIIFNSTAKL